MEPRAKSCMQDGQTPTSHRRHGQAESWSSSEGSTEGAELLQQHSRGRGVKLSRAQGARATFRGAAISRLPCPAAETRSRAGGEDGLVPHCCPPHRSAVSPWGAAAVPGCSRWVPAPKGACPRRGQLGGVAAQVPSELLAEPLPTLLLSGRTDHTLDTLFRASSFSDLLL